MVQTEVLDTKSKINLNTINYEAYKFRAAFKKFKNNTPVLDRTLCRNLTQIVADIDLFLSNNPKLLSNLQNEYVRPEDLSKQKIKETFMCSLCNLTIGYSINGACEHLNSRRHKFTIEDVAVKKKAPKESVLSEGTRTFLEGDLYKFCSAYIKNAAELRTSDWYDIIKDDLLSVMKMTYPEEDVQLEFFGSRVCGIANIKSDLDIFIKIEDQGQEINHRRPTVSKKKLQTMAQLISLKPGWTVLKATGRGSAAILRILHKCSHIKCDIKFSNPSSVLNTQLQQYLFDLQPLVKSMCILVEVLIEEFKINPALNLYGVRLMVITYYQSRNLLPSLQSLQESNAEGDRIPSFAKKSLAELEIPEMELTNEVLKSELCQLLTFYIEFQFKKHLISPFLGNFVPINTLDAPKESSRKPDRFRKSNINIQDPFQPNRNLSGWVKRPVLAKLKRSFQIIVKAFDVEEDELSVEEE